MLQDEEWSHWSDREIARRCNVNHHLVASLREQLAPVITRSSPSETAAAVGSTSGGGDVGQPQTRTYTDRHGNTSTMNTGNIGRTPLEASALLAKSEFITSVALGVVKYGKTGGINMRRTIIALLLLVSGTAATAAPCKIGVVVDTMLGVEFMFGNRYVPIPSWRVDDLIVERIRAAAGTGVERLPDKAAGRGH